jgi:DNA-directed RNA polymerase specialized sigma24 family protein
MYFPTTHWSVLADASLSGDAHESRALDDFVRRYRTPIINFIRARGWPPDEAEDLAQEFFLHVIRKGTLSRADATRGRFRSYIRGTLARFLASARVHANAEKRGGGAPLFSLDHDALPEQAVAIPPEEAARFDHDWAVHLLELSVARVEEKYSEDGRLDDFKLLRRYLPGGSDTPTYADGAAQLGLSMGAFKTEVHRVRRTLRENLLQEVSLTIDSPHEIDLEMQHLQRALAGESGIAM